MKDCYPLGNIGSNYDALVQQLSELAVHKEGDPQHVTKEDRHCFLLEDRVLGLFPRQFELHLVNEDPGTNGTFDPVSLYHLDPSGITPRIVKDLFRLYRGGPLRDIRYPVSKGELVFLPE